MSLSHIGKKDTNNIYVYFSNISSSVKSKDNISLEDKVKLVEKQGDDIRKENINYIKNNKSAASSVAKKYFLMENRYDEKKENLIILIDSIAYDQKKKLVSYFAYYNVIKFILWKRGYFASFFYFTRMSSVILLGIGFHLIQYNKELKIEKYGLLGYYNYIYSRKDKEYLDMRNEILKEKIREYSS